MSVLLTMVGVNSLVPANLEGIDGLPDMTGSGSIEDSVATNNVTNLGY